MKKCNDNFENQKHLMKLLNILFLSFLIFISGCKGRDETQTQSKDQLQKNITVEVQGHRGDRGSFPENSLPAFQSAVEKGVDVLELDVVISKDKKVVVSHEPFMHSLYMLTPQGDSIAQAMQENYNFYEMTYDSIRSFDAGSKGNRLFPDQKKLRTYKPLLEEVIDSVENYVNLKDLKPVKYNIELKSSPDKYGTYQPHPEEFVDLVMQTINKKDLEIRFYLQSFDVNILNRINRSYPRVETAFLVSEEGIEKNLELLDYRPSIYSPHFNLVKDSAFVNSVKTKGMRLIPWTVNEVADIENMIKLEVDGIITDFPERVLESL